MRNKYKDYHNVAYYRSFIVLLVLIFGLIICALSYQLKNNKVEEIIYVREKVGTIISKRLPNTIEVEGYGLFLLTSEEFNSVDVGEIAPTEILKRGN